MTPCPFCAGTKFHYNTKAKSYFAKKQAERERRDTANHLVRCTKCGAKGPLRSTEADAIAAWNIRPPATNAFLAGYEAGERGDGLHSALDHFAAAKAKGENQ